MEPYYGSEMIQNPMNQIFKRARAYLEKNKFLKNLTLLAGSTALAQAVGVLVSPILTRLYTPEDFGVLSLYSSILGILTHQMTLSYEYSIPIAADDDSALDLLFLCFLVVTAMTAVVSFFLKPIVSIFAGDLTLELILPFLWVIPIGAFLGAIYNSLNFISVRTRNYKLLARTKITQVTMQSAAQIGVGFVFEGPIGLLLGFVVGRSAGIRSQFKYTREKYKNVWGKTTFKRMLQLAVQYKNFPLLQTWATLLNNAGTQLFPLLLNVFYGPTVAGFYYLSQKVIGMPVTLISNSAKQVYIGDVSEYLKSNPRKLLGIFMKLTGRMLLIGVLPCLILTLFGREIFSLIFGVKWDEAGRYVQVMAFSFLLKFGSESFVNLALLERQALSFVWSLLRMILTIGGLFLVHVLGLSAFYAVCAYTVAMVFSYLINYIMYIISIKKIIDTHEKKGLRSSVSV